MGYETLTDLCRSADGVQPGPPPDLAPARHRGQRPTIWVATALVLFATMLGSATLGVLYVARSMRGLGEPVPHQAFRPQNRLDREVTAVTVEMAHGRAKRLLAADSKTLHVGDAIKDLYWWQRVPLSALESHWPGPNIVGMSADEGRIVFVCDDNGRRGLAVSTLPEQLEHMSPWSRALLDTSFFPGVNDDNASCLAFDPNTGYRVVGALGVGCYNVAARRWEMVITRESHGLDSFQVNDVEFLPDDGLAIMGDKGISIGRWSGGNWARQDHYDHLSGLVGDDILRARVTAAGRAYDVTYVSTNQGMGRLRFGVGSASGGAQVERFIGEGKAQGLTRDSLMRAAEDFKRRMLWLLYRSPDASDKLIAALYRVGSHEMSSLPLAEAWLDSPDVTLAPDSYTEEPAAWIGGDGLRVVAPSQTREVLGSASVGLDEFSVREVVPAPGAVFVRTRLKGTSDESDTVHGATRQSLSALGPEAWDYYIGPRRFPDLKLTDITAAADGYFEGQPALFLGTKDKGIGVFARRSRELFSAFNSNASEPSRRVPSDGSLDLSALDTHLVQVGTNRSLNLFNGASWASLIPESGTRITPAAITTMAATGSQLVIGSMQEIGHYDARSHDWHSIPPVSGLRRLVIAIERLWAIDRNNTLRSYALDGGSGDAVWETEESNVVDMYGDDDTVAVIGRDGDTLRLWVRTAGEVEKRVIVQASALPSQGSMWSAAAVDGTTLYVAPHAGGIGRYDLATHSWKELPFPPSASSFAEALLATRAGLWFLDGNQTLFFLARAMNEWETVAEQVVWTSSDHQVVIALTATGHVLISDREGGGPPMTTLVGDALDDALTDVRAGVVFNEQLFVATPGRIGRYTVDGHRWFGYSADSTTGVSEFAHSSEYLYARTGAGSVIRWAEDDDQWNEIADENGSSLDAEEIAGNGGPMIVVRRAGGNVSVLWDNGPSQPETLVAATRLPSSVPLTAVAEVGRDLLVASKDGAITGYSKAQDQPWRWLPVIESSPDMATVRQLLVPPRRTDQVVAVGNKAVLATRTTQGGRWGRSRDLIAAEGPVKGAIGGADFYGLVSTGGEKVVLRAALEEDATDPPTSAPTADTLIGSAFPLSEHPETTAVGSTGAHELFRVDASGAMARYDFRGHSWLQQGLKGVERFLSMGEQLWAWSPTAGTLSGHERDGWYSADRDTANWVHVVGDGEALVLADRDGGIFLRTGNGDRALIPALSDPLPFKSADELVALAEADDVLFLAAEGQPMVSYNRKTHVWQWHDDITGVEQFHALPDPSGGLFALTSDGKLFRRSNGSGAWIVQSDQDWPFTRLVVAGKHLAAATAAGHVILIDGAGHVVSDYRPRLIAGRALEDFNLAAAAEFNGRLLLVSEPVGGEAELWVYDPTRHAWGTLPVGGQSVRFYRLPDVLWLASRDAEKRVTLRRIDGDVQPEFGVVIDRLRDAASDGDSLLVVNADGQLQQLRKDGSLVRIFGVADASLPTDRIVRQAVGVADGCVVLLDDGSVHHYTTSNRRWEKQISSLPGVANEAGRLLTVAHGRATVVILVRPDGDLWVCDPRTSVWARLDAEKSKVPLEEAEKPDWQVISEAPDYRFDVNFGKQTRRVALRDGRLDLDDVERVVFVGDDLCVKTPVGVRRYRRDAGTWREDGDLSDDLPSDESDTLVFKDTNFTLRRDPSGSFAAAGGRVGITLKLGTSAVELRPAANTVGAGFGHDVIRDIAAHENSLWLATPGGAVRLQIQPAQLDMQQVDDVRFGLPSGDLFEAFAHGESLWVKTASEEYAERSGRQGAWRLADSKKAREALACPS